MVWNPGEVWITAPDQNGVSVGVTLREARNRGWLSGTGADLFRNNPNTGAWEPVYDYQTLSPGEGYYLWSNIECNLLMPPN